MSTYSHTVNLCVGFKQKHSILCELTFRAPKPPGADMTRCGTPVVRRAYVLGLAGLVASAPLSSARSVSAQECGTAVPDVSMDQK